MPNAKCLLFLAALLALAVSPAFSADPIFDNATKDFAHKVDLSAWQLLAAQHAGRVKILDSVARSYNSSFYGSDSIDHTSPTFTLLELYFNTGSYLDKPLICVKSTPLKDKLASLLPPDMGQLLRRTGRLPPAWLLRPQAVDQMARQGRAERSAMGTRPGIAIELLQAIQADPATDIRLRNAIQDVLERTCSFLSIGDLRIVPPEASQRHGNAQAEYATIAALPKDNPIGRQWQELGQVWRAREAGQANRLLGELADDLIQRGGPDYPPQWRRQLELLHNRLYGFSIDWALFALASLLLLAALAGRHRKWGIAGMAVFLLATLILVIGFAVRWLLSGRGWALPPLTNQYESMLAAAVMAALAGAVLEVFLHRRFFALAASLYAALSMLTAFLRLDQTGWQINAPHGVLISPILSWHVASLMMGYAMIGMSLIISIAYLVAALVQRRRGEFPAAPSAGKDLFGAAADVAGNLLAYLDRCNLILIQIACWLLAIGVALGAYWGDQAWGRWWGWDPKETWGLMTLVVYLAIIHVRFVSSRKSRGIWTAGLAILGCVVMAFTWFGVNYLLAGLHSYA